MVYKQHSIWLIIRLFLILGIMLCIPLTISLVDPGQQFFTLLVIAFILIAQAFELYFFLNRTLRELTRFLEHIRNRDFTLRFNENETKGPRRNLYRTFNDVLEVYREIRIEREVQFRFLEHMIELIELGIIVYDEKGSVVLSNTAASNLLGIHTLLSWDQMLKRKPDFAAKVGTIYESGNVLYEAKDQSSKSRLAVKVSRTRMLDQTYSLMSIQDIGSMVDQKETGAWLDLLRTLNHEIKNSVTPISSLADTIMMILMDEKRHYKSIEDLSQDNLDDIIKSAGTLQQRSKGLHSFIDEYHKLTRLPVPDPTVFKVQSLFREIQDTFQSELEHTGIRILGEEEESGLKIRADRGLIGQVMINLIRNSLDAFPGYSDGEIVLSSVVLPEGVCIRVSDNGEGIDLEILGDVFIPFFTTKTKGSGIGLSLVRQIMRLHGGQVSMESQKGKGTTVSLVFPGRPDPSLSRE